MAARDAGWCEGIGGGKGRIRFGPGDGWGSARRTRMPARQPDLLRPETRLAPGWLGWML